MHVQPPHLELSFYLGLDPPATAARVLAELVGDGARFAGADPRGPGDVAREFAEADHVRFDLWGATRLPKDSSRDVLFVARRPGSSAAVACLCTHDCIFGDPASPPDPRRQRGLARSAAERLCSLADTLKAHYAAVTVETGLPTPSQLRADPSPDVFETFYFADPLITAEDARAAAPGAHIRPCGAGLFITTRGLFASGGADAPAEQRRALAALAVRRIVGRLA